MRPNSLDRDLPLEEEVAEPIAAVASRDPRCRQTTAVSPASSPGDHERELAGLVGAADGYRHELP